MNDYYLMWQSIFRRSPEFFTFMRYATFIVCSLILGFFWIDSYLSFEWLTDDLSNLLRDLSIASGTMFSTLQFKEKQTNQTTKIK